LIENPLVRNTIGKSRFTIVISDLNLENWADPKYFNFIQLALWAAIVLLVLLYHFFRRAIFLAYHRKSVTLGILLLAKFLAFIFDIGACSILLYVYLVSLGKDIFPNSADIGILLSVIVLSSVAGTVNNPLINLPLVFAFKRQQNVKITRWDAFKSATSMVFSPVSLAFTIVAIYITIVIIYLLNKINFISLQLQVSKLGEILQWDVKNIARWIMSVNICVNYLIGITMVLTYLILAYGRALLIQIWK
jgi:hypothetical protein